MKKTVKKLVLAKETLRGLEETNDLKQVAGGLSPLSEWTGCTFCCPQW